MVFRFKRRGGTPQFYEGKFRQKAGICPHDWLHARVELECLSLAKCALDGWSLKAAAKSAQRLCLCETCGSQPDMKFINFFTLVRLPTLLNSSYKFYPSPKIFYTSVTCDNFHVWSQRLTHNLGKILFHFRQIQSAVLTTWCIPLESKLPIERILHSLNSYYEVQPWTTNIISLHTGRFFDFQYQNRDQS